MEQILDLYNQQNKEVIIIIDDENSLMGDLIKDVFINQKRHKKCMNLVFKTNKEDGEFLIKEYNVKEFPCVLFFKQKHLINKITGFCYCDFHKNLIS